LFVQIIMGVEEELEALRKQGVTKKNASGLKDAGGLSTPEAEESAIRAEQERVHIANYGKEASGLLKTPMSTPKNDDADEAKVPAADGKYEDSTDDDYDYDESSVQAAASTQSKDITNLIQITNDFAFVGDSHYNDAEDDDGNENPKDCFFGNGSAPGFCPVVDSSVVDGATQSMRGALDEHIVPRFDEATASFRGAIDEHLVPNIEKARLQSIETINLARHHSMETMNSARDETQRLLGEVQTTSQNSMEAVVQQSHALLGGVQTTSQRNVEAVRQQSQVLLDRSKIAMEGGCKTMWSALVVAATITYAPCFLGNAPRWTSFTTNNTATTNTNTNTIPWYWLLEEASLRAFGRVVFCDNPVTGIFVWLGILCASPLAAFCALLAVLTVNATAIYLDMDQDTLKSGQYARNAVLIGTSLVDSFGFVFPPTGNLESEVSILLFLSVALAPSTLLVESIWIRKVSNNIPSLLLPYNIVLLVAVFCAKAWNLAMVTQVVFQSPSAGVALDEIGDDDETPSSKFMIHEAILNGLSRIFFVDGSVFTGILILIGVLLCSRIVAASLIVGSFVSTFVLGYMVFEENHWYLDAGYAGVNPALCAAGIFFYLVPSWKLTGLALFGIVATVIVQGAVDVVLGILGAPVSTSLGFCLTLLPLLSIGFPSILVHREDHFIRSVPESELSTPEDYLKGIWFEHLTDSSSEEVDGDDLVATTVLEDEEDVEAPAPTNEETPLLG